MYYRPLQRFRACPNHDLNTRPDIRQPGNEALAWRAFKRSCNLELQFVVEADAVIGYVAKTDLMGAAHADLIGDTMEEVVYAAIEQVGREP